jgi:hypothetical protein
MEQKPVVTLNEAGFLSAMKRFLFFGQSALEEVSAAWPKNSMICGSGIILNGITKKGLLH